MLMGQLLRCRTGMLSIFMLPLVAFRHLLLLISSTAAVGVRQRGGVGYFCIRRLVFRQRTMQRSCTPTVRVLMQYDRCIPTVSGCSGSRCARQRRKGCACRGRRGSTLRAALVVNDVHVVIVVVIGLCIVVIVGGMFVKIVGHPGLQTDRCRPDDVVGAEAEPIATVRCPMAILLGGLQPGR
uniref:Uncharacterized protein n=1 Tax=Anopheles christyi TaxID=43041 RepID=A0A182KIP0_9DIPT